MKSLYKSLFFIAILASMISCEKEDAKENPVEEVTPTGRVWMHLHNTVNGTDIESFNTVYLDENGRGYKFSKAQYNISNIELVKLNDEVVFAKNILLKTFEDESYLIGDIPIGNYKAIKFEFGLNLGE